MFPRRGWLWGWALLALLALLAPAGAEERAEKTPTGPLRNWTDASGQHHVKAALIEATADAVRLKKADGDEIEIPLEKLSDLDRRWIAHLQAVGKGAGTGRAGAGKAAASGKTAASSAASPEWPNFTGPNYDNRSPDTGLLKEWPSGGPKLLWKADGLGQGYSSAVVADDTVFVTGEINGHLLIFALDGSGQPKWRTDQGPDHWGDHPGSRAAPTYDSGRLYVLGSTGGLGCYDARKGQRLWAHSAGEFNGRPSHWGYAESPLIYGKLAIFKPGGPNCIVALDKATGRNVWASQGLAAGAEYSSCIPVELGGQTLIVTGTSLGIAAVNARTGGLVWGNPFAAKNTANCPTPLFSDGYIFWAVGYHQGGICLRLAANGAVAPAWTTKEMVCHHGGYVIDKGYIYGNNDTSWSCLELKTGRKMWSDRGVGKGSITWADGMLYLFSENGGRAALATCSPEGLAIRGHVEVQGEGPSWAHPVVIGGRLYLRYDQTLYCFNVKAG